MGGIEKVGWRRQLLLSRADLLQQLEVRRRPPEWAEIYELSTVCTPMDSPRGSSNPPRVASLTSAPGSVSVQSHLAFPAETVSSGILSPSQPPQYTGVPRRPPTPYGAGPLPQSLPRGPSPGSSGPRIAAASQERVLVRPS